MHALLVKNRLPVQPAIHGLPDAAGRGTDVIGHGITRDAGDGNQPVADRADVSEFELRHVLGCKGLGDDGNTLPPDNNSTVVDSTSTGDVDGDANGSGTSGSSDRFGTSSVEEDREPDSTLSPTVDETVGEQEFGELTEIRSRVFQSTAGLLYVPGSEDGHRLQHIMEHAEDEPGRPIHGVFEGDQAAILRNIDIAYQKVLDGKSGVHSEVSGDRVAYTIDLRNRIGYVGGQVGKRKIPKSSGWRSI